MPAISRNRFISSTIGAMAVLPLRAYAQVRPAPPLARVNVNAARVIRTVVGLRPFRRHGFVLRAEAFGSKSIVHNYGHGGGGFSLSWGCATLAADLLAARSPGRAAVIGCGVIGLSTARVLQDRGWEVTIYASSVPPNTTSNIAGAQWTPTVVFASQDATSEFLETFRRAARIANRAFQLMAGPTYGVLWIDNYALKHAATERDELDYAVSAGIEDLYEDIETIDPATTPFAVPLVRRFTTMLIEPNTYLPAVMRDFLLRGGKIEVRTFATLRQMHDLEEQVVFNCTGLGARVLCNDDELVPVRGQLTVLEPQADVDYIYLANGLYMFPRNDGIVLGGTFDRGDWSLEVDPVQQARILAGHATIYHRTSLIAPRKSTAPLRSSRMMQKNG
ncbi:MAG: FAD-dependent oxidoreductase [Candidatus Cybelea sp.]